MAKKKSAKKSNKLELILKIVALAFGVAAFCMVFVTCVRFVTQDGDLVKSFTGIQEVFGYTEDGKLLDVEYLGFSFMALLTFVLPLVGAALTFVNNKIARLVGVGLMAVGAVLMFILPQLVVLASEGGKLVGGALVLDLCETALGIGAILGGVFSALGAVAAGYYTLRTK